MNQELFEHMRKQMTPSPQVRAALSEKLARPVKKRPNPWIKYGALAACAALVIGAFSVYNLYQDHEKWSIIVRNFQHDAIITTPGPLHSYVTVEGVTNYTENSLFIDKGSGGEDINSIEILPAPYTGDLPADIATITKEGTGQEEALNAYQKLMGRFALGYPDWYGGAYIDDGNNLMVLLVSDKDPGDKSLELKVLDWTGSDNVMFSSCKYSLAGLNRLMDQLNAFPEAYPECARVMAGWGIDEEHNRIDLTLTEADESVLSLLGGIDPDDDAIYVQVGRLASFEDASGEAPAVHHVMPGGATVPSDEDLIAEEPYYDGAHYDVLPAELPEQKQPAFVETGSVPEEEDPERPVHGPADSFTPAYDPDVGFISPKE